MEMAVGNKQSRKSDCNHGTNDAVMVPLACQGETLDRHEDHADIC
jgi:hypothetical protein